MNDNMQYNLPNQPMQPPTLYQYYGLANPRPNEQVPQEYMAPVQYPQTAPTQQGTLYPQPIVTLPGTMIPGPQTPLPFGEIILDDQSPETLINPIYTPAYLLKNIGKWMRVEFLVGDQTTDRVGRLVEVGASYIVLQPVEPKTSIMCDIYSLKFATIVEPPYNIF